MYKFQNCIGITFSLLYRPIGKQPYPDYCKTGGEPNQNNQITYTTFTK